MSGEELGYVDNKEAFIETLKEDVKEQKNVDAVDLKETPEYELKFVDRELETNEEEIAKELEDNLVITYKYYEIALNNKEIEKVDTIEEAEELVNEIKEQKSEEDLDLTILEKYTQNEEEANTQDFEIAKTEIDTKVDKAIEEKEEQENKWYKTCSNTNHWKNYFKIWSK